VTPAEDLLIANAARRATLTWKAGESLRRKILQDGGDLGSPAAQKALNDLALAIATEQP